MLPALWIERLRFITVDQVTNYAKDLGFSAQSTMEAISECLKKDLISQPVNVADNLPDRIRILPSGAYMIRKMCTMFTYIDAIVIDTPIIDQKFRTRIADVHQIKERLERATVFIEYLDSNWSFQDGIGFDWKEVQVTVSGEIRRIRERLERNYYGQ
jgi:hypothetical protein